ncbi:hypothetical protein BV22DRAFT_1131376 [Leucogyrophana mollusca]|uniref:Uncharacterized protein n=1 Tax=Leucogyrophana mollusca TaxID=85980 RepID=A0ACB8BB29_9AGAM|nr:hypothetical protein BV22DRAFT_1131376 [Leucogyrophana mollusca]
MESPRPRSPPVSLALLASTIVDQLPVLLDRLQGYEVEEEILDAKARMLQAHLAQHKKPLPHIETPTLVESRSPFEDSPQPGQKRAAPAIPVVDKENQMPLFEFGELRVKGSHSSAASVRSKRKGRIWTEEESEELAAKRARLNS